MNNLFHKVPFLRIIIALSLGIITGSAVQINVCLILGTVLFLFIGLVGLNLHFSYRLSSAFGVVLHSTVFVTGILLYQQHNKKPDFFFQGSFIASIMEIRQEKPKTFQSLLNIHAVVDGDTIHYPNEKVLVWFEKDSVSDKLCPGNVIIFNQSPVAIKNQGNPYEFDYRKYMNRRKIYRRVFLSAGNWRIYDHSLPLPITVKAGQVRARLLQVYDLQNWNSDVNEVISALVLGYKHGLNKEIKQAFTSAGAIHVLAVSGLHVGILFIIVTFLFQYLKHHRVGHVFYLFFVLIILWAFAFITGLSPSVKRAVTMFSFLAIGQCLQKQVSIYNSLAASAFFLLIINPNNLFDAGFQLSYSAVTGIVFLQPKITLLYTPKIKVIKYLWSLLTVSVAAQIFTFPISAYYFNVFPSYFWLSNLIAVPAVTILIPLGIALLVFSWLPFVSALLVKLIVFVANIMITSLKWIERLPFSVAEVYFSPLEVLFIAGTVTAAILLIENKKRKYIIGTIYCMMGYFLISLSINVTGLFKKEVLIYNSPEPYVVHVVAGKRNYIILEDSLTENTRGIIENTCRGLRLNKPEFINAHERYNDSVICVANGQIRINQLILQMPEAIQFSNEKMMPDVLIGNSSFQLIKKHNDTLCVIVTQSSIENEQQLNVHNLIDKGVFRTKWQ